MRTLWYVLQPLGSMVHLWIEHKVPLYILSFRLIVPLSLHGRWLLQRKRAQSKEGPQGDGSSRRGR